MTRKERTHDKIKNMQQKDTEKNAKQHRKISQKKKHIENNTEKQKTKPTISEKETYETA